MSNIEDILDRCLQDIEAGRSVEECLEGYPEWRDELAPLLKAADRLRSAAVVKPSAAFRQSVAMRLANLTAEENGHPEKRSRHAGAEGRVFQRTPLLLYRRLAEYWGIPSILLLLVSAGLLIWNPPTLQELRMVLVLAFLLALGLLWTAFIMRRLTYVECGEDSLIIQLPFYRMRIPYESVTDVRPAVMHEVFPPAEQSFSAHRFLDPLWSKPAVVLQMRNWPQLRQQLRLWIDSRMIVQDGLVLMVEDDMDFRREMQHAIIQWRAGE
jgi:hypothetical protein